MVMVSKIFGTGKKYQYRLTFWVPSLTAGMVAANHISEIL